MHVLFSKPTNLSQELRINDVSLLHWKTGEKRQWQKGKKKKTTTLVWLLLLHSPYSAQYCERKTAAFRWPRWGGNSHLPALSFPHGPTASLLSDREGIMPTMLSLTPFLAGSDLKRGLLLPGFSQTPQQKNYYHCEISSPPSQWSPNWGAHTPGIAQDRSLKCRKKITFLPLIHKRKFKKCLFHFYLILF